jgi:hypothetical protein
MATKKNYQTRITVPRSFNAGQRSLFAQLVIERIRENCSIGKNRYGGSFPKYSKEYTESFEFKVADKDSKPNLELTGDMLASIELISSSEGEVVIGYKSSSSLAGQVEGNQIGSYGQDSPNPNKARPFLGLPAKEIELIVEKVSATSKPQRDARSESNNLIENLLKRFTNVT